jgi:ring-1,2-phenylacetyl-CoA epoxidase subunit PaaA
VKKPEELQAEYLELLESRLKEVGLEVPQGVEADYDMRVGYEAADLDEQVSKAVG